VQLWVGRRFFEGGTADKIASSKISGTPTFARPQIQSGHGWQKARLLRNRNAPKPARDSGCVEPERLTFAKVEA